MIVFYNPCPGDSSDWKSASCPMPSEVRCSHSTHPPKNSRVVSLRNAFVDDVINEARTDNSSDSSANVFDVTDYVKTDGITQSAIR